MSNRHLITSESVTEGHPDKVADQISDAILDSILAGDPKARVACETFVTTGLVLVGGEITTRTYVEIPKIVRETVREIGYTDATIGFDYETCSVLTSIDEQSADIALGVDRDGAGDQGLMFGYATNETPSLMPMPIQMAHAICRRLAEMRRSGELKFLRPDGKSQVTIAYENGRPVSLETVVVSTQHTPDVSHADLREAVIEHIVKPVIGDQIATSPSIAYHINPTGRFVRGGPQGDTGLTGRKIIVDTYGGVGHHGGGAFSGKDPTKVDRSASYMARYVAKNLVAAGAADRCEVALSYAIGHPDPISIAVETFGTGRAKECDLVRLVRDNFPLTPRGIIEHLDLRRPVYKKTAAYGHFGRDEEGFTWEKTDLAAQLARSLKG
jgi:S-adenosylmethionine synthetase